MMHQTPSSRFAAILNRVTLVAAFALPCMAAAIWLFWDTLAPMAAPAAAAGLDVTSIGISGRLGGFALSLTGALVQAYGLLGLAQTFEEGATGQALSARSVAGFQRFAWVTLLMVPLRIVLATGTALVISMTDSVPGNSLSLRLGTPELGALFMGLALVFAAQVFAQGHAADAENQAFL